MDFYIEKFVDISDFPFSDIFSKGENAWESIRNLESFISGLFKSGKIKANYKNSKNIYIGKGTVVNDSAEIVGPAVIGDNCTIRHGALLRENCLLGNNVNVGHACEIKNSIMLNNSTAAHFNYVGDSIIGNNVNISGGAILASLRLDKEEVSIKKKGVRISTGLKKFCSIIGDDSVIGANSVLNPGTILGKNSTVFPLVSVSGLHPENKIIK